MQLSAKQSLSLPQLESQLDRQQKRHPPLQPAKTPEPQSNNLVPLNYLHTKPLQYCKTIDKPPDQLPKLKSN